MLKPPSLKLKLRAKVSPLDKSKTKPQIKTLQLQMLRIQQGLWQKQARAIVVIEGFDAAGKGGAIRALTEDLDPRAVRVHPIGPPRPDDQARHYLYRFWRSLPYPGTLAVFDRSWYGRVLVERVEKLAPKNRLKEAYREINEFERLLVDDGIPVIKIFLAVSADEQLRRFEDRLHDPQKRWKFTSEDIRARKRWDAYVEAVEKMLEKTHTRRAPWTVIRSDDKTAARLETLRVVTNRLAEYARESHHALQSAEVKKIRKQLSETGPAEKKSR